MLKPHANLLKVLMIALLTGSLSACASLSKDGNNEAELRRRANQTLGLAEDNVSTLSPEQRAHYQQALLAEPLTPDTAVALALSNSPRLQRTFAELRLTEAEVIAATRLRNPGVSLTRLSRGSERELESSISFDLMGLLTLPLRGPMEKQRFEVAKHSATQSILVTAKETRLAYFASIAAAQRARYAADVLTAAEAGHELALELAKVGNISRLDAAREHAFYAEAQAQQQRETTEALQRREQFIRLLGLTDASPLKLPDRLPPLPDKPHTLNNVEQLAMQQRVDIQITKNQAESTARALKLSKITRFVNVLDVGYQYNTSNTEATQKGVEVSLELPLFDFGSSRVAQAEAIYRRALADVAETASTARSEARESYARYRSAYDLAQHYRDKVVPLQKEISDEVLMRYNGMLVSTFDLLTQAREQVASNAAYQSALQDFWAAEADLASVLQGYGAEENKTLPPAKKEQRHD